MLHNTFTVSDIIENDNFDLESPFVIRFVDNRGEVTREFLSWENAWGDKDMEDADAKEVKYMTVVNGYGSNPYEAVLVMEVWED